MQLLNIFHSGGLWILPLVLLGFGTYFIVTAWKNRLDKNVTWAYIWGAALFVIGIIVLIWVSLDYKGV